jgi:hypothetical protein
MKNISLNIMGHALNLIGLAKIHPTHAISLIKTNHFVNTLPEKG